MDHLLDKELARLTYSKSYSPWLDVQVETSEEWCASGVGTGAGAVQHLCRRRGQWDWVHPQQVCWWHQAVWYDWHAGGKGPHSEGPRQAGELGLCEPHEVHKGQVQGPARGSGQPQTQVQAGWRVAQEQPWGKGLGGTGGAEAQHEPATCTCSPESQLYPGVHQEKCGQQVERGDSAPLLHSHWDPTRSPASSSGAPNIGKTWMYWSGSRGGPQRWSEGWTTYPTRTGWGSWGCSEKALGWPSSSLLVPEGSLQEGWRGAFHEGV